MKQENPGGSNIVTLLIIGVVGYVGYQYLVSSGMWAQWFGGAAAGTGSTLAQQIAAGLQNGQFVQAGTDGAGNIIVHQVSTGAYYAVNPTSGAVSQASGPGGGGTVGTQPTSTVPITQPNPVATTPPSSAVASQLQAMGNQFMQASGAAGLNVDQWLYYYQIVAHGANPANPASFTMTAQADPILGQLGIGTDASSRQRTVTMAQFLSALNGVGVSGIISVPGQGPIRTPLPTSQNFGGGYGGYSGGGYSGRRGYLN